jgi:hypothetical protein
LAFVDVESQQAGHTAGVIHEVCWRHLTQQPHRKSAARKISSHDLE